MPLKAIYEAEKFLKYPKLIFLLTDGDVGNSDEIIYLIQNHSKETKLYSVGIGNGISYNFINQAGKKGQGRATFIKDGDNINEIILNLVNQAVSPFISEIEISTNPQDIIKSIIPKSFPIVLKNEPIQAFLLLEKEFDKAVITISYRNSLTESIKKYELVINKSRTKSEKILHQIAFSKYIDSLLFEAKKLKFLDNKISPDISNLEDIATNLSVKYQILCQKTAFFLIAKNNTVEESNQEIKIIDIPNPESIDYSGGGIRRKQQIPRSPNSQQQQTGVNYIEEENILEEIQDGIEEEDQSDLIMKKEDYINRKFGDAEFYSQNTKKVEEKNEEEDQKEEFSKKFERVKKSKVNQEEDLVKTQGEPSSEKFEKVKKSQINHDLGGDIEKNAHKFFFKLFLFSFAVVIFILI